MVVVGGQWLLLDTGCPWSMKMPGGSEVLNLMGQQIFLKPLPLSRAFLDEGFDHLNVRFDALHGMDVLGKLAWRFDQKAHMVQASTSCPRRKGHPGYRLTRTTGLPSPLSPMEPESWWTPEHTTPIVLEMFR